LSSAGVHSMSDDADSMLYESKLPPSTSVSKVYSYSANNSSYLGRKNLVSDQGSIIWDTDWDWIQMYDRMLRMTSTRLVQRTCGCSMRRATAAVANPSVNPSSLYASPQHFRRGMSESTSSGGHV